MVRAVLSVTLSGAVWIGRVSRTNPEAEYRLLSGLPTGSGAVEVGEVAADDPAAAAAAVEDDQSVESFELLGSGPDRAIALYRTTDRKLYGLTLGAGVPPEYPVVAVDGRARMEFTTTREGVRRVVETLREREIEHELLSLTDSDTGSSVELLSDHQREVVATAIEQGYYELARAISQAELAARLEVDGSVVNRILRRAERQLIAAAAVGWSVSTDEGIRPV